MANNSYPAPIWDGEVGASAPVTMVNQPLKTSSKKNTSTTKKKTNTSKTSSSGSGSAASTAATAQVDAYAMYMAYLRDLEAKAQAARDAAYNAAATQQRNNLTYAQNQLNAATDRALQEAYINRMLSLRNLNQELSAQGLTGGSAESTLAGLYNNYGNARAQLESERVAQQGSLLNTYQNNMAQLESERAGGVAATLQDLVPQLAKLYASNGLDLLSLIQGAAASGRAVIRRSATSNTPEDDDPYMQA